MDGIGLVNAAHWGKLDGLEECERTIKRLKVDSPKRVTVHFKEDHSNPSGPSIFDLNHIEKRSKTELN